MEMWFNPACSKCRVAKEAFEAEGLAVDIRRYLDDPPTAGELQRVLDALGLEPWEITRTGDQAARDLGVAKLAKDRATWIKLLTEHPELLQRPIIVTPDGAAWIARDPDTLQDAVRRARTEDERPS